jgi:uncharacterized BrkB/YihY/UPF0761 family membrane protein
VFAPLALGIIAIYLILGWLFIAVLDRRVALHRSGWGLWFAIIIWPITILVDLIGRRGPNKS